LPFFNSNKLLSNAGPKSCIKDTGTEPCRWVRIVGLQRMFVTCPMSAQATVKAISRNLTPTCAGNLGSDVDEAKSWMNYPLYGALYNYQAAVQWELCPSGWHVPTVAEMTDLIQSVNAVAGEANGASYFKQRVVSDSTQWQGTNMSGFSALPGGRRNFETGFVHAGPKGYWMALGNAKMNALILDEDAGALSDGENVQRGVSVRCVLDTE
jgi:uncharacterized protein (TIGR02145 family)